MMIDEKILTMKRKITKVLEENSSASKEAKIQLLEELGIQAESANNLLYAYGEMQIAKRTAENVWNASWGPNKAGIDFGTDIRKSSDAEARWTRNFDSAEEKCALLMAIKEMDPNEINEEFLDRLNQEGIRENQITYPALKITYHYYNESKAKDRDLAKATQKQQVLTEQLDYTQRNYESLNEKFKKLLGIHENLKKKFQDRISSDEKNYQAALSQVSKLKGKLTEIQERGIFKTISYKIFGSKNQKLLAESSELPKTLCTKTEKMGMPELDEEAILLIDRENDSRQSKSVDRTDDEWQH